MKQEMESWIEAMREAATEAAARRLTVFVEEAKNQSQTKQGTNAGESFGHNNASTPSSPISPMSNIISTPVDPVFGVPLSRMMPDPNVVPNFFERCLQEIESRGLEEVGIYRLSGSSSGVNRLRNYLNQNADAVDLSLPEFADINIISNIVKLFLRELPEPLLTYDLYEPLIAASGIDSYDERLWAIKDSIHQLPPANYTMLKRLVEHLEKVTDLEQINHMYSTNLALVFGPSLLRPPPSSSSFAHAMTNLGQAQNIVKNLILQYHWIFDVEEEVEAIQEAPATATSGDYEESNDQKGKATVDSPTGGNFLHDYSIITSPTTPSTANPELSLDSPTTPGHVPPPSAPANMNPSSLPPLPIPPPSSPPTKEKGSLKSLQSPTPSSPSIKSPKTEGNSDDSRSFGRMLRSKSIRRMRQAAASVASKVKSTNGHPKMPADAETKIANHAEALDDLPKPSSSSTSKK